MKRNKGKSKGRIVPVCLAVVLLLAIISIKRIFSVCLVEAAVWGNGCQVSSAVKYAANQLKLVSTEANYEECRQVLMEAGILQEGELTEFSCKITRAQVALLCSRIMDFRGEAFLHKQIHRVTRLGRISDLEDAPEELRQHIVRVFCSGIMIGDSEGAYTQSRTWRPGDGISLAGMRRVLDRSMVLEKRNSMSPDGQLIRETDLPVNACEYDYILARFPNSFYQIHFGYETGSYNYMPISPRDYATPVNLKYRTQGDIIEEWKYDWAELVRKHYERKLNFDYRNVEDDWALALANTYCTRFDREAQKEQLTAIRTWVDWAKEHQVILESDLVSVEPSTFYYGPDIQVMAYVRFRVVSCKDYEQNRDNVIFGNTVNLDYVKYGKWYGSVMASSLAWHNLSPAKDTVGITRKDGFVPGMLEKMEIFRKDGLMRPVKKKEKSYVFEYIEQEIR